MPNVGNAPAWITHAHNQAQAKLLHLAEKIGATFPHTSASGRYLPTEAWYWTSGFWPGLIRLLLDDKPDDTHLAALAEDCEDRLWGVLSKDGFYELHHDIGFQFLPTSVLRYRQTGSTQARLRGVVAANLLMGRFNVASGVIEAWNTEESRGFAIIDALMNLPLLTWASQQTGEPRFANVARTHVESVLRHFVREDGSCNHIVSFDQTTGASKGSRGGQGVSPESVWARGQSWAIYGLALAAKAFDEPRYSAAANKVADRFLALNEMHGVPPWDFYADNAASAPRDSSAAAITACGLLELSTLDRPQGHSEALDLVKTLTDRCAKFDLADEDGLLRHGTSNLPVGFGIDVSLIYGDYYYYEALRRLLGRRAACW